MEVIMDKRCEECGGKCCRYVTLESPFILGANQTWMDLRGIDRVVVEGQPYWVLESPCIELEEGKCAVYDRRPSVCLSFEVDGPICKMLREET
jgi:Fe-S-cluster containining protein